MEVRGGGRGELCGLFHEPAEGARHVVFLSVYLGLGVWSWYELGGF